MKQKRGSHPWGGNTDIFPGEIKEEVIGEEHNSKSALSNIHLIEYEQALMSLRQVGAIQNPCLKRTIMMGPKKFIGKKPNQQIHQHTSKRAKFTDFDTYNKVMSSKNNLSQMLTSAGSRQGLAMRSNKSQNIKKEEESSPDRDVYGNQDIAVGGVLSD